MTLNNVMETETAAVQDGEKMDTRHQRILLIGDSMLDGLARRFSDYAAKNGHYLRTVIWYGSTSVQWGTTKDLKHHIDEVKPTFIIISLGTNELGYYHLKRREQCIRQIVKTIGDIPFVWIGPVSWPKLRPNGLQTVIERNVGRNRFFDSSKLTLQRAKDGVHPTFQASAVWVDKVAQWMSSQETAHPIVMARPVHKTMLKNYVTFSPRYKGIK